MADNKLYEESDIESDDDTSATLSEKIGGGESDEEYESGDEDSEIESEVEDEPASQEQIVERPDDSDDDEEDEDEEDDDEEEDENHLQKLDDNYHKKVIENFHPELKTLNYEEVEFLATVVRDKDNNIIDPLHKTLPILSRYEKARALGERAKQINAGAAPFIEVEQTMIDGYLIALKELEQKRIPFIIQRPLPNGASEYWRLSDLEIL